MPFAAVSAPNVGSIWAIPIAVPSVSESARAAWLSSSLSAALSASHPLISSHSLKNALSPSCG